METIRTVTSEVELIAITSNAEELIEEAGRTCYLSFDKKGPDTAQKLIGALVKSGHHSVLEHGYATFRIKGGSRAFTHQLVRHRLMAISQQSQRYCNEDDFKVIIPPAIEKNLEAHDIFNQ
ncbi:MAG: FAD-dependent thymidylate synthase, partial [Patescibacteria group bacterium]